jgi:hypothetical protein
MEIPMEIPIYIPWSNIVVGMVDMFRSSEFVQLRIGLSHPQSTDGKIVGKMPAPNSFVEV